MQGGGYPFPGGVVLTGPGGAGGVPDQSGGQGQPYRGGPDPPNVAGVGGRGDAVAGGDRTERVGRSVGRPARPGQAMIVRHHPDPVPPQRPKHPVHQQGHHSGRGRCWRRGLLVGHRANVTHTSPTRPVVPASPEGSLSTATSAVNTRRPVIVGGGQPVQRLFVHSYGCIVRWCRVTRMDRDMRTDRGPVRMSPVACDGHRVGLGLGESSPIAGPVRSSSPRSVLPAMAVVRD